MRYIRIFSELSNQVRYSAQKRILIEIAVIKLCRPQMEEDTGSVLSRLIQLEKKIEEGVIQPKAAGPAASFVSDRSDTEQTAAENPILPKAISEDIRKVVQNWHSIVSQMPGSLGVFMKKARLSVGDNDVLLIVLDDPILCEMLTEEERQKEITDSISKSIGKEVAIQFRYQDTDQPFETTYVDLEQIIHTEIEYEDF